MMIAGVLIVLVIVIYLYTIFIHTLDRVSDLNKISSAITLLDSGRKDEAENLLAILLRNKCVETVNAGFFERILMKEFWDANLKMYLKVLSMHPIPPIPIENQALAKRYFGDQAAAGVLEKDVKHRKEFYNLLQEELGETNRP
jgi:hypothetical protein